MALSDGTLDVAAPVQFGVKVTGADCAAVVPAANFARCKVSPGARLVLTLGEAAAAPAQVALPVEGAFPQPPVGLSRAGVGGPWDQGPPLALILVEAAAVLLAVAGLGWRMRRTAHG